MGFTNEVMISRMYRDMRLTSIGGGADEVMLGIISKYMLDNKVIILFRIYTTMKFFIISIFKSSFVYK